MRCIRMEKFLRIIDRASEWTGKCASFLVVILTLAIGYDITVRYLFAKANFWPYDLTYMLYGSYTMLGAAYCHYRKGHVRMDLLYSKLSTRGKARMDVICYSRFHTYVPIEWCSYNFYASRRMIPFRSANCLSKLERVQLNII